MEETYYEYFARKNPEACRDFRLVLRELRRRIAKDGPHQRPPGALEAFDKACDELGIPFISP